MSSKRTARRPERIAKKKNAVEDSPAPKREQFPIIGVGASAGGLEAFIELLRALPAKPGFALVYVLHHDGRTESALAQVVQHATPIPVVRLEGARDTEVEADRIYVAEGDTNVTVFEGRLRSTRVVKNGGGPLPIDTFFLSLAEEHRSRAIGVILSGSASDGAVGMKMIKSEGGITFAQDSSAQFKSMPEAAQEAGAVDYTLRPSRIAEELVRIAHSEYFTDVSQEALRLPEKELREVFSIIETSHDVDFTHYKPSTVERRIRRRMALQKIEKLSDYLELLRSDANEAALLYADILIRVTGFFRDPEVFKALRALAPEILKGRAEEDPVRVWVPGCATGEEVYSIAIVLLEAMKEINASCRIQLFGTDLSEVAVDRARFGAYSEAAVADVPPERLNRYFTRFDGGYRIAKGVRDCCIFARQNITKDPPFSRLDLISCRNVMIYLGSVLQRRVMGVFHYALRPNGYLLLGSSETIGNYAELFTPFDRKHKIFQNKPTHNRPALDFHPAVPRDERVERPALEREPGSPPTIFREADRLLLSRYSPPGVIINNDLEILQFRGRTSHFLEPAPGVATFNVLKMAREGLLAELRAAIQTAKKTERAVRREGVRVTNGDGIRTVDVEVIPFVTPANEHCQIVLFEEVASEAGPAKKPAPKKKGKAAKEEAADTRQAARLKSELEATREYLQSIIEEQEAMNEELRSANEEIQSSNEELQSTNEELETAKEELQSSNEELTTLNEELENRNDELAQANNDLINLLASVDIPIVMLDSDLRIRRFNPGAQKALNLIPADTGRSINDLKLNFDVQDLDHLVRDVVDNLETREIEVQDRSGRWYALRVRPYKTAEKKIDGAVLVLIDITHLKKR